jgi:ribosome maturation factor RimP
VKGAAPAAPHVYLGNMEQQTEQQIKAGVDLGRVRAALGPVLSSHGVLLVDLEWLTERAGWTLRLTIEREGGTATNLAGGVTLADCAEVSRDASAVLDVEDMIPQRYNLEVSTPGLERPLRSDADFKRFVGQMAKVKLSRPASDGQKVLRGALAEAPAGTVAVMVDGKRVEAPLADIAEAHLVFELAPQPKKKSGPKGARAGKGQPEVRPASGRVKR